MSILRREENLSIDHILGGLNDVILVFIEGEP